jgi:hypothetical protein
MVVGGMPGGNFDYELQVQANGTVRARGPLEAGVTNVTELDIWVFQKIDEVDAIANNMGSPQPQGQPGLHVFDLGTDQAHWEFRLPHRYGSPSFAEGSATAMGIGAFVDDEEHQTVYWWSEAVTLEMLDEDDEDDEDD